MARERKLSICIPGAALELLKKLDYPCAEKVLASAKPVRDEGFVLSGTRQDFESLAGWVAGDANHADRRQKHKLALLEYLSEEIEAVLDDGRYTSW